jgi:hypothetical protein
LEDVYSHRILVEGWTMDVDVVDLRMDKADRSRLTKESSSSSEVKDGVHVRFRMRNQGAVYSRLECYDQTRDDFKGAVFIAFLPLPYNKDVGRNPKKAMLLEKKGKQYERTGLFDPRWCLKRDGDGEWRRVWGKIDETKGDGLDSKKQKFWLV